jgi:hypothetical protein
MLKVETTFDTWRIQRDEPNDPLVCSMIEGTSRDIDDGKAYCIGCGQLITGHDGNTVFLVELEFADRIKTAVSSAAYCEECSALTDGELKRQLKKKNLGNAT